MKIKVPRKIKIGVHPYKIYFSRELLPEEKLLGQANHRRQTITIATQTSPTERVEVLLHEINETIDRIFNCHVEHDNFDRLAEGQTQFMIDGLGLVFDWSDIPYKENETSL